MKLILTLKKKKKENTWTLSVSALFHVQFWATVSNLFLWNNASASGGK